MPLGLTDFVVFDNRAAIFVCDDPFCHCPFDGASHTRPFWARAGIPEATKEPIARLRMSVLLSMGANLKYVPQRRLEGGSFGTKNPCILTDDFQNQKVQNQVCFEH